VLSTLISGFVVFGGIGWLLDHWWGTHLLTPIGLVIGMALSIYAVVKQFGGPRGSEEATAPAAGSAVQAAKAAQALRAAKAVNRARAAQAANAHSPNDGPPPASTRRETECL
jgi:hypothetical protein